MKEDILEQLVDEYLRHKGYFTTGNVKFKPLATDAGFVTRRDSNASDIDVIGINPNLGGVDRVWVVSCKSYQGGFYPAKIVDELRLGKKVSGHEQWKRYRELVDPKWALAFTRKIRELTGVSQFTYVTAVTKLRGGREDWENNVEFRKSVGGNPVRILTFDEIVSFVQGQIKRTPAASSIGRLLQLMKAAASVART